MCLGVPVGEAAGLSAALFGPAYVSRYCCERVSEVDPEMPGTDGQSIHCRCCSCCICCVTAVTAGGAAAVAVSDVVILPLLTRQRVLLLL
jgi:hypothetical protein